MGSPKELQRLQLSKPDAVSENISLRSPISSRIWQADDPTRHLGFTGEDLSMRNFCVSVQGDTDFLEGSFSFDTEGDGFLGCQRNDSVDALSTLPVTLAEEEYSSLKQQDSTDFTLTDNIEPKIYLEKCLEECTFTATGFSELTKRDLKSPNDGEIKQDQPLNQDTTHRGGYLENTKLDRENSRCLEKIDHEPVLHKEHLYEVVESSSGFKKDKSDTEIGIAKDKLTSHKYETGNASSRSPVPESSIVPSQNTFSVKEITTTEVIKDPLLSEASDKNYSLNTMTDPIGDNTLGDMLPETSTKDKEDKMIHGKSALNQDANTFVDERKTETMTDGKTGCEETANGDFNAKTHLYELVPPNNDRSTQSDRVEYRSIAISPIVPPDGSSSFTFQTGMVTKGSSAATNSYNIITAGKGSSGKDELPKTSSFELTPPNQDVGTETRVQCRSIAVSPIVPPDGSTSFTFQTENPQVAKSLQGSGAGQWSNIRSVHGLHKTYSSELTPSNIDAETETRVEYKSVAVSPIIPPDGSSFTFQTQKTFNITAEVQPSQGGGTLSKKYSFELTPPNQDVGTQADTRAECVSIAVSPIIPPGQSSSFIFQTEQINEERFRSNTGNVGAITPILNQTGTPQKQNHNIGTETDTKVQCISVALSPFVLPDESSSFPFLTEKTAQNQATDNKTNKDLKNTDTLPKTYSFELTPPEEDIGTSNRVEYRSVAISPFVLPGESSFTFLCEKKDVSKMDELTKPSQEVGTQADNKVDCVSVAISPIVLPEASSTFIFQTEQRSQESIALPAQSLQLKPHNLKDVGTQVDTNVQCTSIAVSPFMPMEESCSFTFRVGAVNQETPCSACSHVKPVMKDAEMQVSSAVETRSAATDPMTPTGQSPRATYPEVHVKEPKEDHPEPVREVSWDEKGMTWEVYGASMEVEVLGMAIQKHLEKQIEEHGRQKVLTPQNTRESSIRGTTGKGQPKRQPSTFRTFFHRRPRCCSKAGPAVE